jgi:hypothetical protein
VAANQNLWKSVYRADSQCWNVAICAHRLEANGIGYRVGRTAVAFPYGNEVHSRTLDAVRHRIGNFVLHFLVTEKSREPGRVAKYLMR